MAFHLKRAGKEGWDRELKEELDAIKKRLILAYGRLDMESDEDMIESCIYEILSNEKRYDYLIKKIRAPKIGS